MTLQQEDKDALVLLRIQRAKEIMSEAKSTMRLGYWRLAANRLYYACYHAVSALLVKNNFTAYTHAGVINQFGLHFVAKGLMGKEHGKLLKQLFELRQSGDYSVWFSIEESDVEPFLEPTEKFIAEIENLINNS